MDTALKPAMPGPDDGAGGDYVFDAVLRPHRSLGPRGFVILMSIIVAVSFAAGIAFLAVGAWPVPGFLGLDVVLIYIAFKVNYRAGRRYETVRLNDKALTIQAVDPKGRTKTWTFDPYWVRVYLDVLESGSNRLTLSSHGRHLRVGGFLTPEEREEFADALQNALYDFRRVH